MRVSLDDLPSDMKKSWVEGLEFFNQQKFWEAHEAWEDVWHFVHDQRRPYLQGLIQAAASLVHNNSGNSSGCRSQAEKSLQKLKSFDSDSPLEIKILLQQLESMSKFGTLNDETPARLQASHVMIQSE